jgi:protein Mpv17
LRKWYGILQSQFCSPNKTVNTLKKVAGEFDELVQQDQQLNNFLVLVDQVLFAPAFIGVLVGSIGFLQGESNILTKLKREFPDILVANYKLWPAVQLINFYFVPLNYQVVVVQIVAVAWNSYVSFKTNSFKPDNPIEMKDIASTDKMS